MNLKLTLAFALLLAIAASPVMADEQIETEIVEDASISSGGTPSAHVSTSREIAHPQGSDELPLELTEVNFISDKAAYSMLSCEEIDGTPCTSSASCGSCYPTPTCPLTPCFCGYGVCQCDI